MSYLTKDENVELTSRLDELHDLQYGEYTVEEVKEYIDTLLMKVYESGMEDARQIVADLQEENDSLMIDQGGCRYERTEQEIRDRGSK